MSRKSCGRFHCPSCGRDVMGNVNKLGITVYNVHKISVGYSYEVREDYRPGYDCDRWPVNEINCPMSGQPVDGE